MKSVRMSHVAVLAAVVVGLVGCEGMSRQDIGTVTGGVLGGVLGSTVGKGSGRTAAVIGGTIIGGMMGSEVGRNMDEVNRMRIAQTLESTPQHRSRSWVDDRKDRYTVTPGERFDEGRCRHYKISIETDHKLRQGHGKACQDARGNWTIKESWTDR